MTSIVIIVAINSKGPYVLDEVKVLIKGNRWPLRLILFSFDIPLDIEIINLLFLSNLISILTWILLAELTLLIRRNITY